MKKYLALVLLVCLMLSGCKSQEPLVYNINKSDELKEYESELAAESQFAEEQEQKQSEEQIETTASEPAGWTKKTIQKEPVKVKGIYLTAVTAGSSRMDDIIRQIDQTEINAVVIDIKDDKGNITYRMNSPMVSEIGSATDTIPDLPGLIAKLHQHNIYIIARCVCFRDPFLADAKPEWAMRLPDGSVYRDASGMAWINPYKREVWDYLKEVGEQCADAGFDEIQYDYVRFCTEKGTDQVVYDQQDTNGLDKPHIITEYVRYISDALADKNVYVAADVFGTIIGSYVDTVSVGQDYPEIAGAMDYICPMIYPSHYGDGNFGIEHPDTEPYKTIIGALNNSKKDLSLEYAEGVHQASVRPWLQGFTASYLAHYISYGPEQVRQQIQAVYDAGYDEWLIWNAANNYDWSAFKTDAEAEEEARQIQAARAAAAESAAAKEAADKVAAQQALLNAQQSAAAQAAGAAQSAAQ